MTDEVDTKKTPIVDATTGRPISNSRRRFLTNTGMFSAGLIGSTLLAACSDDDGGVAIGQENDNAIVIGGPPDQAILNFALNLEYLEAEYYLRAIGSQLMDQDRGDNPGMVEGGMPVNFQTTMLRNYANEIAADELHHVQFLRSALGSGAATAPAINFTNTFATLGSMLGVNGFDPFADEASFLLGAFIFEDVGVTAYKGGSPFIKNRTYLEAAAGILAAEAYHAGLLRTVLNGMREQMVGDTGMTVGGIVDAISDFRDQLDGDMDQEPDYDAGRPTISADDDQGIGQERMVTIYGTNMEASNIVPTDEFGVAYSRSIAQVHNIVYATMEEAQMGGFFPQGTNIPGYPELSMSMNVGGMSGGDSEDGETGGEDGTGGDGSETGQDSGMAESNG